MDQATQTAALNADLLVELLSQNLGPQKRESTTANLLPASGEHYAQVRYHFSCTGCKSLSCTCQSPFLMHRSCNISMHRSDTISCVQVAKHLSCTDCKSLSCIGHTPCLMPTHPCQTCTQNMYQPAQSHAIGTSYYCTCISLLYKYTCISTEDVHTTQSFGTIYTPVKHI